MSNDPPRFYDATVEIHRDLVIKWLNTLASTMSIATSPDHPNATEAAEAYLGIVQRISEFTSVVPRTVDGRTVYELHAVEMKGAREVLQGNGVSEDEPIPSIALYRIVDEGMPSAN